MKLIRIVNQIILIKYAIRKKITSTGINLRAKLLQFPLMHFFGSFQRVAHLLPSIQSSVRVVEIVYLILIFFYAVDFHSFFVVSLSLPLSSVCVCMCLPYNLKMLNAYTLHKTLYYGEAKPGTTQTTTKVPTATAAA